MFYNDTLGDYNKVNIGLNNLSIRDRVNAFGNNKLRRKRVEQGCV